MDLKQRQNLQRTLQALPANASERLVLQSRPLSGPRPDPPRAEKFKTRLEFRQALIDYESTADQTGVDAIASRLREMGLTVNVAPHSGMIVVQGTPSLLARALEDESIEGADFDRQIELIRPSGRSQDKER